MSALNAPQFKDDASARRYLEKLRWADGRFCPHCGDIGNSGALRGEAHRDGLYKCYACKKPFRVRMGTMFESSHLPLHPWLQVIQLFCCSKKGISTRQIQRMLNCSLKTAWFLGHRIRFAMTPRADGPIGGEGKTYETTRGELAEQAAATPTSPEPLQLELPFKSGDGH